MIAFPSGSLPEVVQDGETGLLVCDEGEMADAVERVGRLFRAACRRHAEERFSAGRMVAGYLERYRRILREGASERAA